MTNSMIRVWQDNKLLLSDTFPTGDPPDRYKWFVAMLDAADDGTGCVIGIDGVGNRVERNLISLDVDYLYHINLDNMPDLEAMNRE